jgi:hypothetical protein
MKLHDAVRKLSFDDRILQCVLLVFMLLFYGLTLSKVEMGKPADTHDRTFNSMLDHLVHGRFDVDPNIVGLEGYLRDGHVYAYWGITCALLRLPLLLVHRIDLDVTVWSCLAAVCLAGMMKIRTVLLLRRHCGPTTASDGVFGFMLAYIVLGGAGVGYLRSSIYQEVVFWAVAFAAVFVYFAVKGLVTGQFTAATLTRMAMAAGLALLTRVSTGIGLYAALGLLLLVLLAEEFCARRIVLTRRILIPMAVLAVFLTAVGAVNYFRWGKPTTFCNFTLCLMNQQYPDRLPRLRSFGTFNLARIPFGLSYYFLPIWALQGSDGRLLFEGAQTRLLDSAELPPGSFFLTDLLPIAYIAFLAMAMWNRRSSLFRGFQQAKNSLVTPRSDAPLPTRPSSFAQMLALAAGLAVPCLLMLMAMSMNYRYRMEFYPEIDFLAFLGLYTIVRDPALLARFYRHRRWMLAATVLSLVSASLAMILYKVSDFGPSQPILNNHNGVLHYYLHDVWW